MQEKQSGNDIKPFALERIVEDDEFEDFERPNFNRNNLNISDSINWEEQLYTTNHDDAFCDRLRAEFSNNKNVPHDLDKFDRTVESKSHSVFRDNIKTATLPKVNYTIKDIKDSFDIPIDFRDESWKTRFQLRKEKFNTIHEEVDPNSIASLFSASFESSENDYSDLKIIKGLSGVNFLSLTNVCYNAYEKNTHLFTRSNNLLNKKRIPEIFPSKAWNFYETEGTVPHKHYWMNDEGIYIMMFHSNRNIAHFTEVFNFVYHYLHNKESYPPIRYIVFPQYQRDVIYPWIVSYIDVARSLFTTAPFTPYFLEDIIKLNKEGVICFKHAIGVGRIISYSYGGVFTSISEVDTIRAASYKYYDMHIPHEQLTKPRILIMLREAVHGNLPGRAIENINDVRQFFKQNRDIYEYSEQKLELLTPKRQVLTLLRTDILLGAQGSGFANVIYMLPGSVAIAYSPPNVGGFFFNTVSEFSRIYYIGVYNSSAPYPPECKNRINANGESVIRSCLDILYADNIYMETEELNDLLQSAVVHLKSYKYKIKT